ncbi:NAD(P)-dependent oxidoreductase [Porticoccaceae bacterium]|nr:NAD(P)-dependent oxidoreductase [Porticoccaceae bacterium]
MLNIVIFGGSGFIGTFFARHLIEEHNASKVYLYDHEPVNEKSFEFRRAMVASYAQIEMILGDVKNPIEWMPEESIDLVANFAAVHREPGHEDHEYYECNLLGAENVCDWAERVGCKKLIFSSSIAPYGPSEEVRDERSIPVPTTAYGGSKLAAEKIHQIWQAKQQQRQLVIVRPGVVFGPGEGGNVSRLIKAVRKRYFFYMANRDTRKAGIYVKELCIAMMWVLNSEKAKADGFSLFNMSMNPGPSIEEYVNSIARIAKIKIWVPSVPRTLLFIIAYLIDFIGKPLGIKHPFSPVRIRKLIRSNNILPTYLVENGYDYKYTLDGAFADWKKDCPEEWR